MIYRAYITRMVTEHLHVIVDAPNWEEAIKKANNKDWVKEERVFDAECHNLSAHGVKRIDPLEELNMASEQNAE